MRASQERLQRPVPTEASWQDGAGAVLLLAGAHETGLLAALEAAIRPVVTGTDSRLAHARPATRRMLLQTLLFLGAVGLQRPWDLRGYTGTGLALLTGRAQAYGYRSTARFLSALARSGGATALTDALATWTTALWPPATLGAETAYLYLDGHRKAVYSAVLLPRGLVARRGTILGCRALVLLHDAAGHPLVVTTQRGDTHLTVGAPEVLACYERHGGAGRRLVIDREGMAAEFLSHLAAHGYQVLTVLRRPQYAGLASFTDVGPFVPLEWDRHGALVREVAAARYQLPRPEHPDDPLDLCVALIRDRGRTETPPAEPTLIPLVTTAATAEPLALVAAYARRWPAQENCFKDWLLPLGLDTNHGYAKTRVANSESAKKRAALERRLAVLPQRATSARERAARAAQSYARQAALTQRRSAALYGAINLWEADLAARGLPKTAYARELAARKQAAAEALARPWRRAQNALARQRRETAKAHDYEQQHRLLQQQLADLSAQERPMYELDNAQDQLMSVCKVALANVAMWVRAHYFPASYAQATWRRLAPFFRLPGRIVWGTQTVQVTLHPFNDRRLTQDLTLLCERVCRARPHLPDGRELVLTVAGAACPILNVHQEAVA